MMNYKMPPVLLTSLSTFHFYQYFLLVNKCSGHVGGRSREAGADQFTSLLQLWALRWGSFRSRVPGWSLRSSPHLSSLILTSSPSFPAKGVLAPTGYVVLLARDTSQRWDGNGIWLWVHLLTLRCEMWPQGGPVLCHMFQDHTDLSLILESVDILFFSFLTILLS